MRHAFLVDCTRGSSLGRIIAIANQKGGVGKTTTAINLAASLAAAEQRTLLIDCDPQSNTTAGIGFPKDPARRSLYNALILGESTDRIIQKTQVDGLDLLPADKNLVGAAVELVAAENREFHLKGLFSTASTRLSVYRFGLPADLGFADAQCSDRQRQRACADSVRISRARRRF